MYISIRQRLQYGSAVLIVLITALCAFNVWSSGRLTQANEAMSGALESAVAAEGEAARVTNWIALLDRVKAQQDVAVRQLAEGVIGNSPAVALYLTGTNDPLATLLEDPELDRLLSFSAAGAQQRFELAQLREQLVALDGKIRATWMPRHGELLNDLNELKRSLLYWNLKITNMIFVRSSIGELVYETLADTPLEAFRSGPLFQQYQHEFPQLKQGIERAAATNQSLYAATNLLDSMMLAGNWDQVRKQYRDNFPAMIKSIAVDIDQVLTLENQSVVAQRQTLALLNGELRKANQQLFELLAKLRTDLGKRLTETATAVAAATQALQDKRVAAAALVSSAGRTNIVLSVLVILLGLIGSVLLTGAIVRPLNVVVKKMEDVARGEGDLTQSINITARHEMGTLAQHFNLFVAKLREIVRRSRQLFGDLRTAVNHIETAAGTVRAGALRGNELLKDAHQRMTGVDQDCVKIMRSTEQLLSASRESSSATLELSSVIEEISGQTEKLFTVVEEVTSSNQEMSASSHEIAVNIDQFAANMNQVQGSVQALEVRTVRIEEAAERTSVQAEQAYRDAQAGRKAVAASLAGVETLNEIVRHASETMTELGEESEAIGKILQVIDEIAEQTSLLALNATIIAAQAGSHGRAFEVVAGEVRNLADRTAVSTREIATIVGKVQRGTVAAVTAIDGGRQQVEQEVAQARTAGERLREIEESSQLSAQQVKDIVIAAREQAQESNRITTIVETASGMLQHIAASVQQQGTGVRQTARASEHMRNIAQQLRRGAEEQMLGSRMMSRGMEQINLMIEEITQATHAQAGSSRQMVELFEQLRAITVTNSDSSGALEEIVARLVTMAESLEQELGSFSIDAARPSARMALLRGKRQQNIVSQAAANS
ncbi:MAG: HAMP domain-containing methyl-accepting chemotaxis protein [Desulfuromonadales bacterium]|nr:HAMP domain-containing methyl-accepting chemotaxis protein [Desulfuromonadales bacterium]MDT8424254.1 HAMP domain-containing methyl-accepting chemotaxis protein [Desulfuromonadales bacterium]